MKILCAVFFIIAGLSLIACHLDSETEIHGERAPADVSYDL